MEARYREVGINQTLTMLPEEDTDTRQFSQENPLGGVAFVYFLGLAFATGVLLYAAPALPTVVDLRWASSQQAPMSTNGELFGDETSVTLKRSTCFGTCPAYEVTLFGTGRVEFHGELFVCMKSPPATQINRQSVKQLVDGLVSIEFAKVPNYMREEVTDSSTAIVTLKRGSSVHTVEHYHGDPTAPRLLSKIERRIDELAGTSAWLGVEEGGQLVCKLPGGMSVPVEYDMHSQSLEPTRVSKQPIAAQLQR